MCSVFSDFHFDDNKIHKQMRYEMQKSGNNGIIRSLAGSLTPDTQKALQKYNLSPCCVCSGRITLHKNHHMYGTYSARIHNVIGKRCKIRVPPPPPLLLLLPPLLFLLFISFRYTQNHSMCLYMYINDSTNTNAVHRIRSE